MFDKVVYISGHGTDSGIWPRFLLQMDDLAQFAIGKQAFDQRQKVYFDTVIPQITKFYDIYHEFREMLKDYQDGIQSGKYYSFDDRGRASHNKIPETKIADKAKDFFINGKIMLVNFVKCGIIDEAPFVLSDFYFADEKKFEVKKQEYLKTSNGFLIPLIALLEKAQKDFLKPFNVIRGDIEHNHFTIDDFKIETTQQGVFAIEPTFDGRNLSMTLEFYYNNILDLIEKLVAYFLGIKAETKNNSPFELYVRRQYDYPKMLYKYTIAVGGNIVLGTPADKCGYN